jgi:ribosomal protein S18 acetylase RimI-like enzyme
MAAKRLKNRLWPAIQDLETAEPSSRWQQMLKKKSAFDRSFTIKKIARKTEVRACAQIMATSEPWITLKRNYGEALKMVANPLREVYVAVFNGEVIGFIILQMEGTFTGYIQTVAVRADWRGQGLGSHLIAFAERRIFSEKPNVFMCVSSFNKKAQRLYRRLGYKKNGVLKSFIVPAHDEILLRKTRGPLVKFNPQKSNSRSMRNR